MSDRTHIRLRKTSGNSGPVPVPFCGQHTLQNEAAPFRFQVLHQVERYPVVDLNIGVNDTLGCDIMALPKQIRPTNLLVP